MKLKLVLITLSVLAGPAHALPEVYWSNIIKRMGARFAGSYYADRARTFDPIIRPERVPLLDVRTCDEPNCVLVSGRKIELEPVHADLLHGRIEVVGTAKQKDFEGIFVRVRMGSWINAEPDFLLVWAAKRHHQVEILGYTVQRDEQPGHVNPVLGAVRDAAFYKYLTSENPVEVELARELTQRNLFCTKYPADPSDTVRDEVAHLQAHDLIPGETPQTRLQELNAYVSLVNTEAGESQCDSPITDQVDFVLERVRQELRAASYQRTPPKVHSMELPPTPTAPPAPVAPPLTVPDTPGIAPLPSGIAPSM